MTIRIVTTCHKAGFDLYGRMMLENWHNMPSNVELHWYTEGFDLPHVAGIIEHKNEELADLQAFKAKYAFYRPPYYTMDVVRFSNKVFAFCDALANHDGLGVWMDADIVPFEKMPEGYIENLLPDGKYLALFRRKGAYPECGFWVVDCSHRRHGLFLERMKALYTTDAFKDIHEWHDSYLMDVILRNMEKAGLVETHSLSGDESKEHVMAASDIARYLDHLKGPHRKDDGYSPENKWRKKDEVRATA